MEYKKTLTGILAGASISLGSLFYSGSAEAEESKCLPIISRHEDVIKARGAEGNEFVVNTNFDDGRRLEIVFDKKYNTLSAGDLKRISAMSTKAGVNIGTFRDEKSGEIYVYSVAHGSKHMDASVKVCRLNDYFKHEDNYMVSDGLSSLFNVSERGVMSKADEPTNEKTGTDLVKKKELLDRYDLQKVFIRIDRFADFGNTQPIKTASIGTGEINTNKEDKKNGNGKKKENGAAKKDLIKARIPIANENKREAVIDATNEMKNKSKKLSGGLSEGYSPPANAEPINPFTAGEKDSYNMPQEGRSDKNTPVLDEEAGGCSVTDFFRGLFEYTKSAGVAEKAVHDAGFADIDTADACLDAGAVDFGTDTCVDSALDSCFYAGTEPTLEPIAKKCTINGLTRYFALNSHPILVEMYKGHNNPIKIKGDFTFSGSIHNGKVADLLINPSKTTLDETKRKKLEKILLDMHNIPTPRKDVKCGFDEIILRF